MFFYFSGLPEYSNVIGIVFDRLFKLCNDDCEDIRIYSEDCLSKLIKVSEFCYFTNCDLYLYISM